MPRSKHRARKNPSALTLVLAVGSVAALAGGAWWFLKRRDSGGGGGGGGGKRVGVDIKSALANVTRAQHVKTMRGGTLAALKSDPERAARAQARRDRILAERAGAAETSDELSLEGQPLDTSLPVG